MFLLNLYLCLCLFLSLKLCLLLCLSLFVTSLLYCLYIVSVHGEHTDSNKKWWLVMSWTDWPVCRSMSSRLLVRRPAAAWLTWLRLQSICTPIIRTCSLYPSTIGYNRYRAGHSWCIRAGQGRSRKRWTVQLKLPSVILYSRKLCFCPLAELLPVLWVCLLFCESQRFNVLSKYSIRLIKSHSFIYYSLQLSHRAEIYKARSPATCYFQFNSI